MTRGEFEPEALPSELEVLERRALQFKRRGMNLSIVGVILVVLGLSLMLAGHLIQPDRVLSSIDIPTSLISKFSDVAQSSESGERLNGLANGLAGQLLGMGKFLAPLMIAVGGAMALFSGNFMSLAMSLAVGGAFLVIPYLLPDLSTSGSSFSMSASSPRSEFVEVAKSGSMQELESYLKKVEASPVLRSYMLAQTMILRGKEPQDLPGYRLHVDVVDGAIDTNVESQKELSPSILAVIETTAFGKPLSAPAIHYVDRKVRLSKRLYSFGDYSAILAGIGLIIASVAVWFGSSLQRRISRIREMLGNIGDNANVDTTTAGD
jgi:hypothetical protein